MFTTFTQQVSPKSAKFAAEAVEKFRTNGGGSNSTNWARLEALLAAVVQVCSNGVPVEITASVEASGSASAYHVAHRALSAELLRPYWGEVQIVALRNVVRNGDEITGESSTTRGNTVLICKAA